MGSRDLKWWLLTLSLLSMGLLVMAYGGEYVLSLRPCILCLYERVPYQLIFILGLFGFVMPARFQCLFLGAIVLLLMGQALLCCYHVLVEEGMVPAPQACQGVDISGKNFEEAKALLLSTPLVPCTEVPFRFLGISLAGYNLLISLFLSIFSGRLLWKKYSNK